jgi:hypothetical protein
MNENAELYKSDTDSSKPTKDAGSTTKPGQKDVEETLLQRLTTTIKKKVERSVVHIDVPERPNVTLRISPNITQNQMRTWRKNAGEDTRNGMDATKFACAVIGHTTVGICINGEEVFDGNGYELNFASPEVMAMTNTTRPLPDCVREFFGVDPHIEAAALAILDAAGYSDTVETVDPTKESSTI